MSIEIARYHSALNVPREFAWNAYMRRGIFDRLVPPWQQVRTTRQKGTVHPGDLREIELSAGPLKLRWLAIHERYEAGHLFTDRQIKGPFRQWRHQHRFVDDGEQRCTIHDEIEFELPVSRLTHPLALGIVRSELRRMFRYRHFTTFHDFRSLYRYGDLPNRSLIVEGTPQTVVTQLRAVLEMAGYVVADQAHTDHPVQTRIEILAGEGGKLGARIITRGIDGDGERHVRSATIVSPSSPIMRIAHALQFIDVSIESPSSESFEWATVDDFIFAILRALVEDQHGASVYVCHAQRASLRDMVNATSPEASNPKLRRVPSIIVDRLQAELATTRALPGGEHELVDARSRFQSVKEAVAVLNGRV